MLLGEKYRVVAPIGAGAMGMVYVVEHIRLHRRFAAKLLGPNLARHPDAVARFETEARAASGLDHENIVSVLDYGVSDAGFPFIIMELLRGETLQERMDRGAFSVNEAVGIVIQVCQALAAAHAAGIVHRDVKPDNIFLARRPGGQPLVKMLDFGIAKARDSSPRDARITRQGQLLGSPEYMSPEAARGDDVDARADIYAVGILLYELLCGVVPFRHGDYHRLLQMQALQPPAPPSELAPHLPAEVERLVLRALEKDPGRRQPSIKKLQLELMAALPEVAQRVLHDPPPGARGTRHAGARPESDAHGIGAGLAEGTVAVAQGPRPEGARTLAVRRRAGPDLLVALWTGAAILAATAVILLVMKRSAAPLHRPGDAPSAQVDSAARAGRTAEADPARIRLRISTSPAGAVATLQGQSNRPHAESTPGCRRSRRTGRWCWTSPATRPASAPCRWTATATSACRSTASRADSARRRVAARSGASANGRARRGESASGTAIESERERATEKSSERASEASPTTAMNRPGRPRRRTSRAVADRRDLGPAAT